MLTPISIAFLPLMMATVSSNPNFNNFLPDCQIQRDLFSILWTPIEPETVEHWLPPGIVEIDENHISIPADAKLEVIAKSYRQNTYEGGFGNHYATLVAIGGVVGITAGIPKAQYCYATLFYSADKNLITVDFHSEMR